MKKKIISKISEGLGNQLFMYANSYSLSKKNNFDHYIDTTSGYYQNKHMYDFILDRFCISAKKASKKYTFDNFYKNFLKKTLILIDKLNLNNKFYFEKKDLNKFTQYSPLDLTNAHDHFFLDGNFESEKYFNKYRNDLLKEFDLKNKEQFSNNKYLNIIKKNNVVSICVRQNRFSERVNNRYSSQSLNKSSLYVEETIDYINKAMKYFNKKIDNPKYLIWSNDFNNLEKYFDSKKFIFVVNDNDKILTDFFLLTQCKYFIVGPSTFHWWGAWLANFEDKICVRPKNLNPSNNKDFWPEKWVII